MRPGDFSPGNPDQKTGAAERINLCFNEAGGFLPRKPGGRRADGRLADDASMRPGDFSPGNVASMVEGASQWMLQ